MKLSSLKYTLILILQCARSMSSTECHSTFPLSFDIHETSPSDIASWIPPMSLIREMISTSIDEEVLNDKGLLEISSFEWGASEKGVEMPFILCTDGGREGVVVLMEQLKEGSYRPLWSQKGTTCFLVQTTPEHAMSLPYIIPKMKYVMPYSSLYSSQAGMIRYIAENAYLEDKDNCKTGVRMSTFCTLRETLESIINAVREDIADISRLVHKVTTNFYWIATEGMEGREETEAGMTWKKGIDQILSSKCTCDFSKVMILQDESLSDTILVTDLCDMNEDPECASSCMLFLFAYLSTLNEVQHIENVERMVMHNIESSRVCQTGRRVSNPFPFWDVGLNGSGSIVQVLDDTFESKNCYFLDPNRPPVAISTLSSPVTDLNQRKVVQHLMCSSTSTLWPTGTHGDHVAGTVGGHVAGTTPGINTFNGIAPGCKLAFAIGKDNANTLSPIPANVTTVFAPAYAIGARIFTNSWGSAFGPYFGNTYYSTNVRIDEFLYQFDDAVVLASAGNSGLFGRNTRSVGHPSTSKNIICVGATFTHNTFNASVVAYFSSIGPAQMGRIKPDIVAPGASLLSARTNSSCSVSSKQGTSMACPTVAGVIAVIQQYFRDGYYPTGVKTPANVMPNPSGALCKAVIINSGVAPEGFEATFDRTRPTIIKDNPSIYAGWGRIQMNRVLRLNNEAYPILYVKDRMQLSEGQVHTYKFTVPTSSTVMSEFTASIVWMDIPSGSAAQGRILHNLDLTAVLDSDPRRKTIFPNGLRFPDNFNNVERIIIPKPIPNDVITVKVTGTVVSLAPFQKYALVASGVYVPAAWYCQDPRTLRPDTLYRTENCRRACQTNKRNPICCAADAGDTCTPSEGNETLCTGLTKPLNC